MGNARLLRIGAQGGKSFGSPAPPTQTAGRRSRQRWALHTQLEAAGASGVLLDWHTGKVLAAEGKDSPGPPGSLLKPFLLAFALQHGFVTPGTSVYCRRMLQVGGRSLPCTHPAGQPVLDAEAALALSCNTWFATLASRMTPEDVRAALEPLGLHLSGTGLQDTDTRVLTALGLKGTQATPAQMAAAYRFLLLRESHTSAVWKGLRGSVTYGMASNARWKGIEVLGKTGTASSPGEWWTHGWFAGGVPGRVVLVVHMPHGDGGRAAGLAGGVFRQIADEGAL